MIGDAKKLAKPPLSDNERRPGRATWPAGGSAPALLVIKERDVGWFSLMLQVVNTLLYVKETGSQVIPVVDFSDQQAYFTDRNTWTQVFEPLVPIEDRSVTSRINEANGGFRKRLYEMRSWDKCEMVYRIRDDLYWTGSYYPRLQVRQDAPRITGRRMRRRAWKLGRWLEALGWRRPVGIGPKPKPVSAYRPISHLDLPNADERQRASAVIGTYIRPRERFREQVTRLFAAHCDAPRIGVQFRGTDARADTRRITPAYDDFLDPIRDHLASLPSSDRRRAVVFAASDEQGFLDFLAERLPNVVAFASHRGSRDQSETDKGPMGWGMPAMVAENRSAALEGAMADYVGLCACDVLIHGFGSLSTAVLLTRPDMPNVLVGDEYVSLRRKNEPGRNRPKSKPSTSDEAQQDKP